MTYGDILRPAQGEARQAIYDASLVLLGSVFIALLAQLTFYLPWNPLVPITGQTFAVLMVGALLGSKRGSLSALTYLGEGVIGLPVFAGGLSGPAVLTGPTGGYLIGFVVAAFVVGLLTERGWDRLTLLAVGAMAIGNLLIYLTGVLWLSTLIGLAGALENGLIPFIPGDLIKIAVAAALLPSGWRVLRMLGYFPDQAST